MSLSCRDWGEGAWSAESGEQLQFLALVWRTYQVAPRDGKVNVDGVQKVVGQLVELLDWKHAEGKNATRVKEGSQVPNDPHVRAHAFMDEEEEEEATLSKASNGAASKRTYFHLWPEVPVSSPTSNHIRTPILPVPSSTSSSTLVDCT